MKYKMLTVFFFLITSICTAQDNGNYKISFKPLRAMGSGENKFGYAIGYGVLAIVTLGHPGKYDPPKENDKRYADGTVYLSELYKAVSDAFLESGRITLMPLSAPDTTQPLYKQILNDDSYIEESKKKGAHFMLSVILDRVELKQDSVIDKKHNVSLSCQATFSLSLSLTRIDLTKHFYWPTNFSNTYYYSPLEFGSSNAEVTSKIMARIKQDLHFWCRSIFPICITLEKIIDSNDDGNKASKIIVKAPGAGAFNKDTGSVKFDIVEYVVQKENTGAVLDKPMIIGKAKVSQVENDGSAECKVTEGGREVTKKMVEGKKLFLVPRY